jgi:hypothetical protein
MRRFRALGVIPAIVVIPALLGLDSLLSGNRLVRHMIEALFETLADIVEMVLLCFGQFIVMSVKPLFSMVRIELVLNLPSRFANDFPDF